MPEPLQFALYVLYSVFVPSVNPQDVSVTDTTLDKKYLITRCIVSILYYISPSHTHILETQTHTHIYSTLLC